ncbi:hypothetical protein KsCSTR_09590 [Candidatus Kuenenia stuttgartiensis]|uniref:Uncharacterized protein n=1 Tax=Kuenenia stuttgartiensis TaxID=174633 RepID=A0A6G7GL77_KUEST|nr:MULTISPECIES: hypothetical protein [Kuenenia]MBE7547428.1 hypothetical protein [Planctomycetia bacterium]MCF6152877.1 hypothetical protein [Candidatus Kuenenia stuttgartiensis]MCL4727906.1 hypothetical protein [Candidatus Kuenenia stuttgartiensis]MCZ7623757.1 hypothetical protein [Candidatus Kuenenia sp.]QII10338.1 hypothetical protein KsCSTR_09590 [Candidatus Kuenenia stuttgartiensis]
MLLITGNLLIGLISGEKGWDSLSAFAKDIFSGICIVSDVVVIQGHSPAK